MIDALRIPSIIVACLVLIGVTSVVSWNNSVSLPALLLIKLTGCIITGLLLRFEIDKSNPLLKQFCTAGKNTNCSAVLNSKSAKLFNFISWSEIGFFYFAGSFIFLLLSPVTLSLPKGHLSTLAWLNLSLYPTPFSPYFTNGE